MLVKNISYAVFFRLAAMGLSLLMVPLLLKLLGVANYGTWAALTSLIVWITLFDLGMGNALKNTVSKSLVTKDLKPAQRELFQVIKITLLSSFILLVVFFTASRFVDLINNNWIVAFILFVPLILSFPLRVASFVLQGARKIALDSGLVFLNSILLFVIVFILYFMKIDIDLFYMSIAFTISNFTSVFLVWVQATKTLNLPALSISRILSARFDLKRINVGLRFFGLQLSSLVLYSIGVVVVYSYLSSEHAAQFDVVNKIFVFGLGFFTIVIGAFWPEISTHLAENNIAKIRSLYFRMLGLSILFSFGAFIVAYFSPYILQVWTNSQILIRAEQAMFFAMLVSFQAIAYSGAVILNVYERVNIQLLFSLIATVLMVPFSAFLINHQFGIEAIPIAAGGLTFFAMLYCNIHAYMLIKDA